MHVFDIDCVNDHIVFVQTAASKTPSKSKSTDMDGLAEVYDELSKKSSKGKKIWLHAFVGAGSMQSTSIGRRLPR